MGYLRSISIRSAPISLCSRKRFQNRLFIDGAEHRAGFVRLQHKLDLRFIDLPRERLEVRAGLVVFLLVRGLHGLQLFDRLWCGALGKLVWEKEIPRVAVAHVLDLVLFADVAHVAQKYYVHCPVLLAFAAAVAAAAAAALVSAEGGSGVPLISSVTIFRASSSWGSFPAAISASVIATG